MINLHSNFRYLVLGIPLLFYSCSSLNKLTLTVTEPAPVSFSPALKRVGIINRSLPSLKNEQIDNLDKILTLEGKNLDKDGASAAEAGLLEELQRNQNITEVKIIDNVDVSSSSLGIFPTPLSWQKIDELCSANNVDAIFSLAFYDTDTRIDYKTVPVEIVGPLGIKVPALEHHATVNSLIKTGWRIYDPKSRQIVDEYSKNKNVVLTGVGINPLNAVKAVLAKKESILKTSHDMARSYAQRILPYDRRVSREYYVRGTNNFKVGRRRAQTGDWDGAAILWKQETTNPKLKIAGRAYYNMAIISEINGDLDAAIEWASKAYTDFENKNALRYLNVLKTRVEKNRVLEYQGH
ncbi:MAG: tetratricopeptide repeat protein [Bacteroidetes bacterium]|nr:MAG: tetratricopeptide repeat protein [Bacteroidota bacterium]